MTRGQASWGGPDLAARPLLPPPRRWVAAHVGEGKAYFLDAPEVVDGIRSGDGLTRKFLLRLRDGQMIETVLMGYDGRHTVCVSTQAGCAMGCVFCATGQMGFVRHLRPGEIVAQVLHARRVLRSIDPTRRLRNMVLMGMGEPMHNNDSVLAALLAGIDTHINLIPLKPTGGFAGTASATGHQFQKILQATGFPCTFRQRRGIDVEQVAACSKRRSGRDASMPKHDSGQRIPNRSAGFSRHLPPLESRERDNVHFASSFLVPVSAPA